MKVTYVMKILLPLTILCACWTTTASAYPAGDINEDWKVDFVDLQLLVSEWRNTPDCFGVLGSECSDISGDVKVNLVDFFLIANKWMTDTMPTLVINEFMESNDTGLEDPDEAGEFPDWIEIYNYGTGLEDLSGMQLNDSSNTYVIPDSVVGRNHKSHIATHVERKSRYTLAVKLGSKSAEDYTTATVNVFEKIPATKVKTFTVDNGKEFANFKGIETGLTAKVYFANPYHSWERGTNENTNGLLRQFFPKGTDFNLVSQKDEDIR